VGKDSRRKEGRHISGTDTRAGADRASSDPTLDEKVTFMARDAGGADGKQRGRETSRRVRKEG